MTTQIRHGDVLLTRIGDAAENQDKKNRKYVAALGEVTGHAHVITAPGLRHQRQEGLDLVELPAPGKIDHEEHGTLQLDRGIWEVRRQQEWIETERRSRNVRD